MLHISWSSHQQSTSFNLSTNEGSLCKLHYNSSKHTGSWWQKEKPVSSVCPASANQDRELCQSTAAVYHHFASASEHRSWCQIYSSLTYPDICSLHGDTQFSCSFCNISLSPPFAELSWHMHSRSGWMRPSHKAPSPAHQPHDTLSPPPKPNPTGDKVHTAGDEMTQTVRQTCWETDSCFPMPSSRLHTSQK